MTNNPQPATAQLGTRGILETKYRSARMNLIMMFAFTIINTVLLIANSTFYFLFSATVPYQMMVFGLYLTGKLPAENYSDWGDAPFLDSSLLVILAVIAAVIMLAYLCCFLFSKGGKYGWIIVALALFSLDSLCLLYLTFGGGSFEISGLIDIAFHAWVIYYLIIGVASGVKLRKLPADGGDGPSVTDATFTDTTAADISTPDLTKPDDGASAPDASDAPDSAKSDKDDNTDNAPESTADNGKGDSDDKNGPAEG